MVWGLFICVNLLDQAHSLVHGWLPFVPSECFFVVKLREVGVCVVLINLQKLFVSGIWIDALTV